MYLPEALVEVIAHEAERGYERTRPRPYLRFKTDATTRAERAPTGSTASIFGPLLCVWLLATPSDFRPCESAAFSLHVRRMCILKSAKSCHATSMCTEPNSPAVMHLRMVKG